LLELRTRSVAVAFLNEKPEGLPRAALEPAGCGYWRRAAEGESFYTEAEDHLECPIGAQTHGVAAPPTRKGELEALLTQMCKLCYISMDEVPSIAHREEPFQYAVPGAALETLSETLEVIVEANKALEVFHRSRLSTT